jgi:hypothetical protein
VKVRFSSVASCTDTAAFDLCAIRVAIPNAEIFDPPVNGVDFVAPGAAPAARSFEWVKRLGAGKHTIRVQAAVQNAATTFAVGTWTLDVEVAE